MNLVQTLVTVDELCQDGNLISVLVGVVKTVFTIIQFGVPAVLIILCAIDMFKAMTNGDEKEVSKAKKASIRRLIYALVIFLIIPIIRIVLNTVNSVVNIDGTDDAVSTFDAFMACWDKSNAGSKSSGGSSKGVCRDYNGNQVSVSKDDCYGDYYWDTTN